ILTELSRHLIEKVKDMRLHEYGTGSLFEEYAASGNLPIRNFRDGEFQNAAVLSAKNVKATVRVGMEGCYACPIRCKKIVKIDEPFTVDPSYGGPEYEALASLGSNCGVDDLKAVCKANEICNRFSIDAISAGVSIAFAMECYENGLISDKETGGLKLKFGNAEALVRMVEMIGRREGLGDLLAEGVKRASEKIGKDSERFAMHVKGQEIPMHEPRFKKALGVGYAVSPTGADHMHNIHDTSLAPGSQEMEVFAELGILEPIPLEKLCPGKIRALIYAVDWRVLDNCLLLCNFVP
ncbi:aldehyde ferredoxin oxidoreductase C-terminal domain-containing protein, partial [Candidatus Bathyarchaeota archaeon]|nr:aldehyde ferredoxin oxidoreductase C-terminal domain-containing protein [Candidatus Bathyarchaeota archaeon]